MVDVTPEDAVFTKEDAEMYRGLINGLMRDAEFNIVDWLKLQSENSDNIEGLINFINLRKTGDLRLQHKSLMLDYAQRDIDRIIEKKDEIIRQIGSLANFDPNVEAVSFPPDPGAIIRLVAMIAFKTAVLVGLTALMIEMENLLTDRLEIKDSILQRPLLEVV